VRAARGPEGRSRRDQADGYGHARRNGKPSSSRTAPTRWGCRSRRRHPPAARGITCPSSSTPTRSGGPRRPRPRTRSDARGPRGARAYAEAAAVRATCSSRSTSGSSGYGVPAEQAVKVITAMLELPHLRLAGLCPTRTRRRRRSGLRPMQLGRFTAVVDRARRRAGCGPTRLLAARPSSSDFPRPISTPSIRDGMLYGITFPGETSPVPLRPRSARSRARHRAQELAARAIRGAGAVSRDGAQRLGVIPSARRRAQLAPRRRVSCAAGRPTISGPRSSTRGSI